MRRGPLTKSLLKMDCVKNKKIGISTVNLGKETSEKGVSRS